MTLRRVSTLDLPVTDFQGRRVDLALDGTQAIVGVTGNADEPGTGAAYIYDALTGELQSTLTSPGPEVNARFGGSVALHEGVAVVGVSEWVPGPAESRRDNESVYVFDAETGRSLRTLDLRQSTTESSDFGQAVAIHGDVVLVHSWLEPDDGSTLGALHAFDRHTGDELYRLRPDTSLNQQRPVFFPSIATQGEVAVVDGRPAKLVDVNTGQPLADLEIPLAYLEFPIPRRIAVSDVAVLVGSGSYPPLLPGPPLRTLSSDTGQLLATLEVSEVTRMHRFGHHVGIDDRHAYATESFVGEQSVIHVFDLSDGRWLDAIRLEIPNIRLFEVDADLLVVGGDPGSPITVFQVVPEPHTAALLALLVATAIRMRDVRRLG